MRHQDLFHGGVPGLKLGDRLLPPDVTGARHTMPTFTTAAELESEPWLRHSHLVYCTADIEVAAACAAIYPDGAIYRVRLDLAFPDPDNPINHACGPEGTVLAVEYAQVPLWTQDALMREALRAEARGDITPQVRKALWAMRLTGLG